MKKVALFTDGACIGNPGPGGWAALLRLDQNEKMLSGGEKATTNNRMELSAVIGGLNALTEASEVTIITDSQYVMNAFVKGWMVNWRKNGWKTADNKPVKNQDLWQELSEGLKNHKVTWEWVKGHAGHRENELVDAEARRQASAQ